MENVHFYYERLDDKFDLLNSPTFSLCCEPKDKMEEIFKKYGEIKNKDIDDLIFLNYNNKEKITNNKTLDEYTNHKNYINIIVIDNGIFIKNDIFSKCDFYKLNLVDYRFTIEDKNGNKKKDILLENLNNSDNNKSKLKCDKCQNILENYYSCIYCKVNICEKCKLKHDNRHKILDYSDKNYICEKHYINYDAYCNLCKKNICSSCKSEHTSHQIIYYKNISLDKNSLKNELADLKDKLCEFNLKLRLKINDIKEYSIIEQNLRINIMEKIMNNLWIYYKICKNIINKYKIEKTNYEHLQNIKDFKKNKVQIIEDISTINNSGNYFYYYLTDMYSKICNINLCEFSKRCLN